MEIDIVRGYLTDQELTEVFNPESDERRRGHVHGTAMHLMYPETVHRGNFSPADTTYSAHRYTSHLN